MSEKPKHADVFVLKYDREIKQLRIPYPEGTNPAAFAERIMAKGLEYCFDAGEMTYFPPHQIMSIRVPYDGAEPHP